MNFDDESSSSFTNYSEQQAKSVPTNSKVETKKNKKSKGLN
jgi:hypothetical protein